MRKCAPYIGSPFQAELMLLGYYLSHQIMVYLLVVLLMMCVWRINLINWLKSAHFVFLFLCCVHLMLSEISCFHCV